MKIPLGRAIYIHIASITLRISQRYNMQIIQVYAPTISHTDEEIEEFYSDITQALTSDKSHYKFIIGDFNAKIGKRKDEEQHIGKFGIGERNERGERLIQFANYKNMFIANTLFQKHTNRKWTWEAPNAATRNEIDFILTNKHSIVKNVNVLNKFRTGSDHRLVRAKIVLDVKTERFKLIRKSPITGLDLNKLKEKSDEYQEILHNRLSNQENISTITETIMSCAKEVGGGPRIQNTHKKLSDKTKQLFKQRREMKTNTDTDRIEYRELCKTIRKKMEDDIQKYNERLVENAIENRKNYRNAKRALLIGKRQVIAFTDGNNRITNRQDILNLITEYYSDLYKAPDITVENNMSYTDEEIPEVLTNEVEKAVKEIKNGKAAGHDDITAELIKYAGTKTWKTLAKIYTDCLRNRHIPDNWNTATIVLIHKKGSKEDIRNYRPISLLPITYKLFTKIINNRIKKTLDDAQPREQAGFHNQKGLWPTLFYQDNYDDCFKLNNPLYCSFKYTLQPPAEDFMASPVLKGILDASGNPLNYRHDILRHGICVPKTCPDIEPYNNSLSNITYQLTECYDKMFERFGLTGEISDLKCDTEMSSFKVDFVDELLKYFLGIYLLLIVFASFTDEMSESSGKKETFSSKLLQAFSLKRNWIRLKTIKSTPDVEKLRAIQGVRFYNMLLVILAHTLMFVFMLPISNTDMPESHFEKWPIVFLSSGPLSVSTYFMISAWLMIDGILSSIEHKKELDWKTAFKIFMNRYLRTTPTYILIVAFHATWLRHMGHGPYWNHYVGRESEYCRRKWWANILYIENFIDLDHMCMPTTWYLSLSMQYSVIILLLIIVIKKYPKSVWFLLTTALMSTMSLAFYENYVNDFPMLVLPYPEALYNMNYVFQNKQFQVQYTSFWSNLAGPLVGLGFGYIYYKNKHHNIFTTEVHTFFWGFTAYVLGPGILIIPGILGLSHDLDHDKVWASAYIAISKAVFSFSVGFAILGTTNGVGGPFRKVLEWPPLYVLGRLTYSAYLVHIPLILTKTAMMRYPLYVNEYYLFCEVIGYVTVTYLVATVVTLLVEMPLAQLQKTLLSMERKSSEEEVNNNQKKKR